MVGVSALRPEIAARAGCSVEPDPTEATVVFAAPEKFAAVPYSKW